MAQQQQPTVRKFYYPIDLTGTSTTPHIHGPIAVMQAADLNNSAMHLMRLGDLIGAETAFREALKLKIKGAGLESSQAALSSNALGELYLKMGKLEEAQELLEHAERVRSGMLFSSRCV